MRQLKTLSLATALILFFTASALAETYQVQTLSRSEHELLERPEDDELKNQLYCHGEEFIEEYSQYINSQIKPRLRQEIPQTTQVLRDQNGRLLKMANHISTGDLFHAHLRVPIAGFNSNQQSLAPRFLDPETFHIQYHSFETYGLFVADWKSELYQIDNQELETWLEQVQAYEDEKASMGDPAFGSYHLEVESDLEALTPSQLEAFSLAWFTHQYQRTPSPIEIDQWLLTRLKHQLEMMDPKNLTGGSELILGDRSFITQDQHFKILPSLNLDGYIQFANIYFAPLAPLPGIQDLLNRARQEGINILYNVESSKFPQQNFNQIQNSTTHITLINDLFEKFQSMNDPRYVFFEKLQRPLDKERFLAFMWDDQYIYAIRYSLLCD